MYMCIYIPAVCCCCGFSTPEKIKAQFVECGMLFTEKMYHLKLKQKVF